MRMPDDPKPRVRPIGDDPSQLSSRPLSIAGAVLLAIIASTALFLSTSADDMRPPPTLPLALPTTSTTSAFAFLDAPAPPPGTPTNAFDISERTARLLDSSNAVWEAAPGVNGEFAAVIGTPAGTDLIRVVRNGATLLLQGMAGATSVSFDRSGQLMAYIADLPTTSRSTLYIDSLPVAETRSFAWHMTRPGRIAWLAVGSPSQLCWSDIDEIDVILPSPRCVDGPAVGFQLVGFDDEGFIAFDGVGRSVIRLDGEGHTTASMTGDDVVLGPSNMLIVVDRGTGTSGETTFTVAGRDLTAPSRLDWAPPNATGTPTVAAWSPSVAYPEIAFMTWDEDHYQLQVYDLEGRLNHAVDLEGRVLGLEWDSTGRYLLIPGTLETFHILYIFDASEDRQILATMPFAGSLNEAVLVTPTECLDADHVVEAHSSILPNSVTLSPAQMVTSRDAFLLAFTFVSARIIGGSSDGQVATWALPGFTPATNGLNMPIHIVAVNEAAASLGLDNTELPINLDWMTVDGALDSQYCLATP